MLTKLRAMSAVAGGDYFIYLMPSVLQGVIGLMLVPVTTYYLSPSDFGVYALVSVLAIPVKAVAATGARWVIGGNYFRSQDSEREEMLFNVLVSELGLRTILIALLAVCAKPILDVAVHESHEDYLGYFYIALGTAWAGSLWSAISFLMTLQGKARSFALFASMQFVVSAGVTLIGLVIQGLGVKALFLGALAASVVSMLFEVIYVRKYISARVSGYWLREIARTGLRATPGGLVELVSGMLEKILIQRWAGLGSLGLYSHSQQYQSIFKMLTSALSNVLAPASFSAYSNSGGGERQKLILTLWYGMLGVAGIGVALFSDDVIRILTHGKFTGAAPLVQIWYLIVFCVSHSNPYASFLMARKHNKVLMYTQVVPTAMGIGLVAVGTYHFGIIGAAWAIVGTNVLVQAARRILAGRLGYQGVAESQFAWALGLYLSLWTLDVLFAWNVATEIAIAIFLLPMLTICLGLWAHLRRVMTGDNGDHSRKQ